MSSIEATSFEQRLQQANRFKTKFPNALPVVIQKDQRSSLPSSLHNQLFLAPRTLGAGDFLALIRKKASLAKTQTIIMFVGKNNLVTPDNTLFELYNKYSEDDGFLYVLCTDHEVYGN